jgi:bifunctional non-homologous end joining protein LigD
VRLLTRNGRDRSDKYPSAIAALKNINARTAYFDGELCGIDESGLPTFARTQAASDSGRGVHVVYYAFDLMHLDRRNLSLSPLNCRSGAAGIGGSSKVLRSISVGACARS